MSSCERQLSQRYLDHQVSARQIEGHGCRNDGASGKPSHGCRESEPHGRLDRCLEELWWRGEVKRFPASHERQVIFCCVSARGKCAIRYSDFYRYPQLNLPQHRRTVASEAPSLPYAPRETTARSTWTYSLIFCLRAVGCLFRLHP
jgi:hypothetical protein